MNADKSVVGDLINFRGLVYAPLNENGVVFLFGKVVEDLNMYVEEVKPGFPDCIARRFTGKGWERVRVEFEHRSSAFQAHGHDASGCDVIVCWEHDWPDCPIEVIELRDLIKGLENWPIERPGATGLAPEGDNVDAWFAGHGIRQEVRRLFDVLNEHIKSLDEACFYTIGKTSLSFYCPERVFLYVWSSKTVLSMSLFTRGEPLAGVSQYAGATIWGGLSIRNETELRSALLAITESYKRIKKAIANNERTGWYASPMTDEAEPEQSKAQRDVGELAAQFHEAMLDVYRRASEECGYTATRFLNMVNKLGGLQAAKRLLSSSGPSQGLQTLKDLGRLDISMEALVIDPKWQSLFAEEEIAIARRKLEDYGYRPGGRIGEDATA